MEAKAMWWRFVINLGVVLALSSAGIYSQDDNQPVKLTQEDKNFFEQLFAVGLFDPKGAEWTAIAPANKQARSTQFYWKKGTEYWALSTLTRCTKIPSNGLIAT
jgi:hypothetical protein